MEKELHKVLETIIAKMPIEWNTGLVVAPIPGVGMMAVDTELARAIHDLRAICKQMKEAQGAPLP